MKPFRVHCFLNGRHVKTDQVDDPFVTMTTTVKWDRWDLMKLLFHRDPTTIMRVVVDGANLRVVNRVMNTLHDDCAACGTSEQDTHGDHSTENKNA